MASYAHSRDHARPDDTRLEAGAKRHRQSVQHLRCIQPMTYERQIALIAEARAARLRDHGPQGAEGKREDGGNRQR